MEPDGAEQRGEPWNRVGRKGWGVDGGLGGRRRITSTDGVRAGTTGSLLCSDVPGPLDITPKHAGPQEKLILNCKSSKDSNLSFKN